eukprot:09373.XXX_301164_301776_1 [CDS] Oithona nana genome sequencing.
MDSQDSHSPNRSKTSGTSNFFCRICHDEGEDLLSPCNCTGTVGLVHLSCLEKWLSTIGSQSCELCKYEFQIDCKTKSIREWFQALKEDRKERRYVICDLVSFVVLTPMLVFSFALCVIGACHYLDQGSLSEAKSLFFLCGLLLLIYIFWICLLTKHNLSQYNSWQKTTMDIKLKTIKEQV